MEILYYLIVGIVAYLLGSFNIAIIITKYFIHEDVRSMGSGNAGATNVARVFGIKLGVITLIGDFAKTALSMLFGGLLAGEQGVAFAALTCFIGHCWPAYFKFKGGKGVAVGGAIALMLDWRLFLIIVFVFLLMAFITKTASASSITAAIAFPVAQVILGSFTDYEIALGIILAVLVWFLHRGNIKRMLNHTEPKFAPKSVKKSADNYK